MVFFVGRLSKAAHHPPSWILDVFRGIAGMQAQRQAWGRALDSATKLNFPGGRGQEGKPCFF